MSSDNHIFHDLTECEIEQTITKAIETTEKKVKYFICLYIIVDNFCFHTNFSFFLRLVVQKQIDWRERTRYHLKFYSCIITYLHGFSSISNFQHFVPLQEKREEITERLKMLRKHIPELEKQLKNTRISDQHVRATELGKDRNHRYYWLVVVVVWIYGRAFSG